MPEMLVLQDLPTIGVIMRDVFNGYAHELTENQYEPQVNTYE